MGGDSWEETQLGLSWQHGNLCTYMLTAALPTEAKVWYHPDIHQEMYGENSVSTQWSLGSSKEERDYIIYRKMGQLEIIRKTKYMYICTQLHVHV